MSRRFMLAVALLSLANYSATAVCQVEESATSETKVSETKASAKASGQDSDALAAEDQARIEALEKTLSGATLVGHYTESGQAGVPPRAERYELAAVKHLGQGQWLFKARIRYGDHDLTLPMTLPILWAGDTPVITVDKLPVVGMGTFDARVMIFQDHYAGVWSGGEHHGQIYGKVQPPKEAESPQRPAAEKQSPERQPTERQPKSDVPKLEKPASEG